MEEFFTVKDLAELWKLSPKTIRRLFKDDPHVLKLAGTGIYEGTAKRQHVTLRIPASVAAKVRVRLTNPVPKPAVIAAKAPRPIRRIPKATRAA